MTDTTGAAQQAPPQTQDLGQTILGDLKAFGGWLGQEAQAFGQAAWNGVKVLFGALSAEQYTIVKGLVQEVSTDENAGMGIEATVADVLTLGTQKEIAWLASVPSQALAAGVALAKHELGMTQVQHTLAPALVAKVQALAPPAPTAPPAPAPTTITQELAALQNAITDNEKTKIRAALDKIAVLTGA